MGQKKINIFTAKPNQDKPVDGIGAIQSRVKGGQMLREKPTNGKRSIGTKTRDGPCYAFKRQKMEEGGGGRENLGIESEASNRSRRRRKHRFPGNRQGLSIPVISPLEANYEWGK